MEIKKRFLEKYLHEIAIEQLVEEYFQKGYNVTKEGQIGNYRADLIAKKGDETIVIEVKSGKMTPDKKETIRQLGNFIRSQGNYKFFIVVATPPKEKKLEIAEIESLLFNALINRLPSELDELSTHTRIDEITEIDIDEISINGHAIFVKGDGVVSVELQIGSDGDLVRGDGLESHESFPFDFEITLEYNVNKGLEISEVDKFYVDTSSFYD